MACEITLDRPEAILSPMGLASFDVKRRYAPQAKVEQRGAVILGDRTP